MPGPLVRMRSSLSARARTRCARRRAEATGPEGPLRRLAREGHVAGRACVTTADVQRVVAVAHRVVASAAEAHGLPAGATHVARKPVYRARERAGAGRGTRAREGGRG